MLRFLPYLGGVLFFVALIWVSFLVYRYATKNDRIAPKRTLIRQINRLQLELSETEELITSIGDSATLWKDECPNLADPIIIKITEHKSARAARSKELYK